MVYKWEFSEVRELAEVGLFWWEMDLQHGTKATARNEVRLKERKNEKPERKKKSGMMTFLCVEKVQVKTSNGKRV